MRQNMMRSTSGETPPAMPFTDYQAKYLAHELTRRHAAGNADRLTGALADAQVDLNPHQIDAALFAFRSPVSHGVLIADEVGLGKTIEAGLVLAQLWAERRRRLIVIVPANLRVQWLQELTEKFFLPCRILESASYNTLRRENGGNPFATDQVIVCSYQFARSKAADLRSVAWDLVVMDEAHRVRNVYRPGSKIARDLRDALTGPPEAASDGDPAPEQSRRAVWADQLHRRARLRRPEELPGAVRRQGRDRAVRRAQGAD